MRLVAGLLSVALSALVASGAGLAASGSADELTGLWSGTDTDVREGESNSTTWEGTATIERRGDTYTLVYEITQFSQEFGHDSCSSTSVTTGEGSTTPEENGRLVFVGEAITDITSDCKFYESSGGKAQQVGERSTVGHLMEGDVIRLDLLPASHIEMQPQMEPMPEWGVIVLDDGSIDLVPPPDGVLSISRSDLPGWAADQVATVGAPVAVVGPPDVVLEGDNRVLIDGAPVARVGDPTGQGGQIVEGSDRILVNGTPAAVVGSMTVNPMITGEVPHVGGPIVHAGTYDTYRLLTEPEYRARMQAIAEAEYFIWEVETLDKFGYAYGMSVYDVLRTEEAITEQRVEHALGRALHQLQEAGHNVVRGDFDDVEIGDGVVIGGDPTDVGIVVDKGRSCSIDPSNTTILPALRCSSFRPNSSRKPVRRWLTRSEQRPK